MTHIVLFITYLHLIAQKEKRERSCVSLYNQTVDLSYGVIFSIWYLNVTCCPDFLWGTAGPPKKHTIFWWKPWSEMCKQLNYIQTIWFALLVWLFVWSPVTKHGFIRWWKLWGFASPVHSADARWWTTAGRGVSITFASIRDTNITVSVTLHFTLSLSN